MERILDAEKQDVIKLKKETKSMQKTKEVEARLQRLLIKDQVLTLK